MPRQARGLLARLDAPVAGEAIFIDCGTTLVHLAEQIPTRWR